MWLAVLLLALVARLLPMLLLPVGAGYDIDSFRLVADALLNGEDVYTSAAFGRHPYLPMQMYAIGAALWATRWLPFPFVVLIKAPAVLADLFITALIYRAGRRQTQSVARSAYWALLFALNPISILVSAYHGQFDAVSVLLLFAAWYLWQFGRRGGATSVALGFAILNKTWPIVLLPVLLIRLRGLRRKVLLTTGTLLIPLLLTLAYVLVFDADPEPMLSRALTHTGNPGFWGATALLAVAAKYQSAAQSLFDVIVAGRRWLILAAGLAALWQTRRQSVADALTTTILSVFVVTAGIGLQWLLWVIPFALVADDLRWLKRYSYAGMLFQLVQLYGLHMYPWLNTLFAPETADVILRLGSVPAWLVVLFWTLSRYRAAAAAVQDAAP